MGTGRNEPCPCASERKYKNCCLRKEEEEAAASRARALALARLARDAGPLDTDGTFDEDDEDEDDDDPSLLDVTSMEADIRAAVAPSPFRDAAQAARVGRALCAVAGLPGFFDEAGPTHPWECGDDLEDRRDLSTSQRRMIGLAVDFWLFHDEGNELPPLDWLLALEPKMLGALGDLIRALADGHEAIDSWAAAILEPRPASAA
jgi:hypothetical protein